MVVNSKALTEWIVALGFGGLSLTKRVPDWVLRVARRAAAGVPRWLGRRRRLRPARASSGSVLLTCANEALLGQARELAELSGLRAGGPWSFTQPYRHAPERMQIAWRLGISGDFERLGCRNPKRTGSLRASPLHAFVQQPRMGRRSGRTPTNGSASSGSSRSSRTRSSRCMTSRSTGRTTSSPRALWCTTPRWFTTTSGKTWRSRASSSWTLTRRCVSTPTSSSSTSAP